MNKLVKLLDLDEQEHVINLDSVAKISQEKGKDITVIYFEDYLDGIETKLTPSEILDLAEGKIEVAPAETFSCDEVIKNKSRVEIEFDKVLYEIREITKEFRKEFNKIRKGTLK